MAIYSIKTKLYSDIFVYKDGIEYLRLVRSNQFIKTKGEIYLNNKLVFQYDYSTFLCFTSLKIRINKLSDKYKIKKKLCYLFAVYENNKIFIKFSLLPFLKTAGKIFLGSDIIGKIGGESMNLSNTRSVSINDNYERFDIYILVLLLIELTHIDSE